MPKRRSSRRRHRRSGAAIAVIILSALLVVAVAIIIVLMFWNPFAKKDPAKESETTTTEVTQTTEAPVGTVAPTTEGESQPMSTAVISPSDETTVVERPTIHYSDDERLAAAQKMAAMYDYDGAIALLQSLEDYASHADYVEAIQEFTDAKSHLVKWADNKQITHVFFHTLIADTSLAFDGDSKEADYNMVMTTIEEFNKIIDIMYDEGYVLVSPYDMAKMTIQEDGTEKMTAQAIYLPAGKKPFVLSQDDVSYYEYMTGDGYANRLVVEADGSITNEMELADGSVVRGAYDMVPLIDDFVEKHPDFSYHGAKGIIALTGYNGVLGYRTSDYSYRAGNEGNKDFVKVNPNIDADKEAAKVVAQAMKNEGWLFATHGWGHRDMGAIPYEHFTWDIDLWEAEVASIVGPTDLCIFPKGSDIGHWRSYLPENNNEEQMKKINYMMGLGFRYFFPVDSNPYWVQYGPNYFRQGRRNLDGQRMYEVISGKRDLLSDLFDAHDVFDERRPTPVG